MPVRLLFNFNEKLSMIIKIHQVKLYINLFDILVSFTSRKYNFQIENDTEMKVYNNK